VLDRPVAEPILGIALVDMPGDYSGPRCINCDAVDVERFDGIDGCKFKLDPARLVYSLRWLHKAAPPDYELVLLRDTELWERWVNGANLLLLAELRRRAPHAIDGRRAAARRLRSGRAIQDWFGHRSIQHTVRYTELTPTRLKDFWGLGGFASRAWKSW
jgi:hypothetical protein